MNAVQRLLAQTIKTFSSSGEAQSLESLREAVGAISASDIGLRSSPVPANGANCGYVHVAGGCGRLNFTVCIFILRKGAQLPMHNHPGMTGLLKVLYGRVLLNTFTVSGMDRPLEKGEIVHAEYDSSTPVTANDAPCLLTPSSANVHEIKALENSAFLDVLSPPYDPDRGRCCSYFNNVSTREMLQSGTERLLEVVAEPSYFWTEPMPYQGPPTGLPP